MRVNPYLAAAGMGVVAGMRSMSAPAQVSGYFVRHPSDRLAASPLRWLGLPATAQVFKFLALGEVGAEKLPFVPARIEPGPLGARGVSGALAGGAVCLAEGESWPSVPSWARWPPWRRRSPFTTCGRAWARRHRCRTPRWPWRKTPWWWASGGAS